MWPEADIFTAVYDEHGTEGRFSRPRGAHARSCSGCGRRRGRSARCCRCIRRRSSRSTCPGYDLVVSSSSAWAHAVIVPNARSTSATATTRSAMPGTNATRRSPRRNPVTRAFLRDGLAPVAPVGLAGRAAVDRYVANSRITQARIRTYFGRDSEIVHPPVDIERFSPGPVGEHYAVVSELMPHKQIDVAVAAFNRLRPPARDRRRRPGRAPAAAARRPDDRRSPGRVSDAGRRADRAQCPGADRDRRRGVRDRGGRGPGRRAAGDRAGARAACSRP